MLAALTAAGFLLRIIIYDDLLLYCLEKQSKNRKAKSEKNEDQLRLKNHSIFLFQKKVNKLRYYSSPALFRYNGCECCTRLLLLEPPYVSAIFFMRNLALLKAFSREENLFFRGPLEASLLLRAVLLYFSFILLSIAIQKKSVFFQS